MRTAPPLASGRIEKSRDETTTTCTQHSDAAATERRARGGGRAGPEAAPCPAPRPACRSTLGYLSLRPLTSLMKR
ncbi:unnamed protein product [Pieris macdunnoughi]|uniref:Uncharacterized protein n=1 Tax=Pieris macdunnoughi TaxID=345717 RepID=A0A821VTR9_9NEOP|nr:unnamed protein product [Pieris macdunnoughi]